jgi:NAD(P)-dependent dehydrogenase (short-subunit alcohol dehydrogenase family)
MIQTLFGLDGRVAVVTGAAGRLGPIWVETLLDAGASVLAIDRVPAGESTALCRLVERCGPDRVRVAVADVRDRPSLEAALDVCEADWGPPHVLVNNAGIDQPPAATGAAYLLEDIPMDVGRAIFDANVLGAFQVMQVCGARMVRAGRGTIINIGSLYASVAPNGRFYDHIVSDPPFLKPPAYGASKAALVNLTRYVATQWAPHGVRVNALSPGGVRGDQDPAFVEKFSAAVPLGRMAEAGDLRGPLLFLASDASAYVTGFELVVDGGFTAW